MRVAVLGGHGKTGRAVVDALVAGDVEALPLGRADWPELAAAVAGCDAAYVIAPNLHPDEPAYVTEALAALAQARVPRVVYHSVASPYVPAMPHHLGKAAGEDLVRRSALDWTILCPTRPTADSASSTAPTSAPRPRRSSPSPATSGRPTSSRAASRPCASWPTRRACRSDGSTTRAPTRG